MQFTAFRAYRLAHCTLALLLSIGARHASAQPAEPPPPQCLTMPLGTDNQEGPPPAWFKPMAAGSVWRPQLHDFRWANAAPFTLCSSSDLDACANGLEQAEFRVLRSGAKLYIAVHNLADDSQDTSDAVFLAVGTGENNAGGVAAKIVPAFSGPPVAVDPGVLADPTPPIRNRPGTIQAWSATTATTPGNWQVASEYAWLQFVATWKNSPGVSWAVTAVIDLQALAYANPSTAPVRLFVGSRHVLEAGGVVDLPSSTPPKDTVGFIDGDQQTNIPRNKDSWTLFDSSAANCLGRIRIAGTLFGVLKPGLPGLWSDISACPPGENTAPGCPATNEFSIQPRDVPADLTASPFSIRTSLRVSDWGLLPQDASSVPWTEVADNVETVTSEWSWDGSTSGRPVIGYRCSLVSPNNYCPVVNQADVQPTQSMLVILRPPKGGANQSYRQAAAFRTMSVQKLSTMTARAIVRVPQLPKDAHKASDVYVVVQRRNMPEPSDVPRILALRSMEAVYRYATNPPALAPIRAALAPKNAKARGATKAPAPAAEQPASKELARFDPLPVAQLESAALADPTHNPLRLPTLTPARALAALWPTYMVYGYLDTGKRAFIDGSERIVLEPMVPFGYYLTHQGAHYGFSDSLDATVPGGLEQIAKHTYKLSVPARGVALTTTISAEPNPNGRRQCPVCCQGSNETTRPVQVIVRPHCYCSVPGRTSSGSAAFGLLGIALALGLRYRRPERSGRGDST